MNNIEERLWDYIDGLCAADEHDAIKLLIANDEAYRLKYEELIRLNADFANIELEEPSMAFNYKVMEAIRLEAPLKPLQSAIDKRVIWTISAFFLVTIIALLIFVLANINWSFNNSVNLPVKLEMPKVGDYFNGTTLRVFILFDIVLSMYIADTYLRGKLNNKTT
jgi:hypothetical protein